MRGNRLLKIELPRRPELRRQSQVRDLPFGWVRDAQRGGCRERVAGHQQAEEYRRQEASQAGKYVKKDGTVLGGTAVIGFYWSLIDLSLGQPAEWM